MLRKNRLRNVWYIVEKDDAKTIKKRCSLSGDDKYRRRQSNVQTRDVAKLREEDTKYPEEEDRKQIWLQARTIEGHQENNAKHEPRKRTHVSEDEVGRTSARPLPLENRTVDTESGDVITHDPCYMS